MQLKNHRYLTSLCLGIALAACPLSFPTANSVACAQDAAAPSGESVLDAYLEAIGGAEKLESHTARRITAKFSMPQLGIKGPMTITQAAPKKYRMETELPSIGKIVQICDGENVLDKNPLTGERMLEGLEKEAVLLEANYYADSKWREMYKKVPAAEKVDVDGEPCLKLVLEAKSGSIRTNYYSAKTKLLVKSEMTVDSPQGKLAVESKFSDYKAVKGVLFPHKTTQTTLGQQQVVEIEKIELDPTLAADTFVIPGK